MAAVTQLQASPLWGAAGVAAPALTSGERALVFFHHRKHQRVAQVHRCSLNSSPRCCAGTPSPTEITNAGAALRASLSTLTTWVEAQPPTSGPDATTPTLAAPPAALSSAAAPAPAPAPQPAPKGSKAKAKAAAAAAAAAAAEAAAAAATAAPAVAWAAELEAVRLAVAAALQAAQAACAPFMWVDGPLVTAMRRGDMILVDEINLADDAVLERLNRQGLRA